MSQQERLFDVPSEIPRQRPRAWRPSKDQRMILSLIEHVPADADEIFHLLDCELKRSTIDNHLETLARNGMVADSGIRGGWTVRGRRWSYRITAKGQSAL